MHHLVGYYESIDPAASYANIAAMADPSITVQGDDIRIPRGRNYLVACSAMADTPVNLQGARLSSPSLRRICNHYIAPVSVTDEFGSPTEIEVYGDSAIILDEDESVNLQIKSNPAAASAHAGFMWLSDGPIKKVSGEIRTILATATVTLSAGVWVNGALTFAETLPVGEYDIVGMRVRSTNGIVARLVFVDMTARPGVPCIDLSEDSQLGLFRYGNFGVFGRFNTTTPPTIDILGDTDTSQDVHLDIIKVS